MNGIGGRTVAEAKERLAAREVMLWQAYRDRHGSLNALQRADYNAGLLASIYANSKRRSGQAPFDPYDFTRFQEQKPVSLEQAMANWG